MVRNRVYRGDYKTRDIEETENRFHHVRELCQQKESRRIMNTEIDLSNKVNKAHTESNDFIHSRFWYNLPAKLKVRSEESPGGTPL